MSHPVLPSSSPLSVLPRELQTLMKMKSSRDPNSRFSTKLHALLSYCDDHPDLENVLGCHWVNGSEFRMNKTILAQALGIKLNTLNIDLRKLGFFQVVPTRDHWGVWSRRDFCQRNSAVLLSFAQQGWTVPFKLGEVSVRDRSAFERMMIELWAELAGPSAPLQIPAELFLPKIALKLKADDQELCDALDFVNQMIVRTNNGMIEIDSFARFMARFGPAESALGKIADLLAASKRTGLWIQLPSCPRNVMTPVYGEFQDEEPNCLVIWGREDRKTRVWNRPIQSERYIIDEMRREYRGWTDYFLTSGQRE